MGDRNATDFAELAHLGLLRTAGLARLDQLVSYRSPVPRGGLWEFVMIDDHVWVDVGGR